MNADADSSLLIVGWSARAAAASAHRSGRTVDVCDAFLDADLRRMVRHGRQLDRLNDAPRIVANLPDGAWMYAGGMENDPDAVDAISRERRLLGNPGRVLRRVRDPFELQRVLHRHNVPFPETYASVVRAVAAGEWLVKPRRSGGGRGIARFDPSRPLPTHAYLQKKVSGTFFGASYVAAAGRCCLLGVCRQFASPSNANPFWYHGSIGPQPLAEPIRSQWVRLGEVLAAEFDLCGLFGVDAVVTSDGCVVPLEVNPRYTASMELLERSENVSLVDLHCRACDKNALPSYGVSINTRLYGKRIVYYDGPQLVIVSAELTAALLEEPDVADIPTAGAQINPGEPLATVFAVGDDETTIERRLQQRHDALLASLSSR